jgi:uncharacterized protein (DUF924 family)
MTPVEVLDFWLGEIGPKGWYAGTPEIDDACAVTLGPMWAALTDGGLEHWVEGTAGTLAYLVLADQVPRNIFRGEARAFSTDARALAAARRALEAGWDLGAPEPERQFFYMPFEHSEDPESQALAVRLMDERMPSDPEMALHARAHQAVIAQFGRFPGRNAVLGRESTEEEVGWLAAGGYMSVVRALKGG